MTIDGVISLISEVKPNQMSKERLIGWLSDLDRKVFDKIICTHERPEGTPDVFTGYGIETPGDTVLLIPDTDSEIYRWYLEMQIDLTYREMEKYANSRDLFNEAYETYKREYNQRHMPIQQAYTWKF